MCSYDLPEELKFLEFWLIKFEKCSSIEEIEFKRTKLNKSESKKLGSDIRLLFKSKARLLELAVLHLSTLKENNRIDDYNQIYLLLLQIIGDFKPIK